MRIRSIALAGAALLVFAGSASASDNGGWYLGLGAGYDQLGSVRMQSATAPFVGSGRTSYSGNAIYLGSAGYKWDSGLRIELELGFDQHDASKLAIAGGPIFLKPAIGGGVQTSSALVNFVYDMSLGGNWGASLGGGVGAANVNEYLHFGPGQAVSGARTALEWQGIAGLNYALGDNVDLFADYRYRSIDSDSNFASPLAGPGFPVRVFQNHEQVGLLGVRWFLDREAPPAPRYSPPPPPPAPPPPPPAPPPPVKTFIVFFDFDKSDLTDKAQQVVQDAVTTAKASGFVKVLVTGHTDTVGSDTYNQALSIRRADAVRDEMVREGLDGGGIEIVGKSFHDPLVATGPGVREPQNRRAVIDLGG